MKHAKTFSAAALLACALPVHASTFTVNPTRIMLSAATPSALLTVTNGGSTPVRLQIKWHGWSQSPLGEMTLTATDDLIVFPTLFSLGPGEQRTVRIARATTPATLEKTYRVFVEELPPVSDGDGTAGIRMLTRMGIPVFIQPARPVARAGLRALTLDSGRFSFRLENLGTVHFLPTEVQVHGYSGAGHPVLTRTAQGWYVLAGGLRAFDLTFDGPECADVRRLSVEVTVGDSVLSEQLQTPGGVCPG